MLYFLTLTQRCNLACTYCGSSEEVDIEDLVDPLDCKYKVDALSKLTTPLNNGKEPMVICFYGGEPLLQLRQINFPKFSGPHKWPRPRAEPVHQGVAGPLLGLGSPAITPRRDGGPGRVSANGVRLCPRPPQLASDARGPSSSRHQDDTCTSP
ncbi:hypothetical protein DVH05_027294 [Phytophthora capsici]|nr:hypothetical protein DVH05_027294 [Phytophthora capsici]